MLRAEGLLSEEEPRTRTTDEDEDDFKRIKALATLGAILGSHVLARASSRRSKMWLPRSIRMPP